MNLNTHDILTPYTHLCTKSLADELVNANVYRTPEF